MPLRAADAATPATPEATFDEIVIRGFTIKGRIKNFGADDLLFEPAYAKGELRLEYKDIQQLTARGEYHVILVNGGEVSGRIVGITSKGLLVESSGGEPQLILRENLNRVVPEFDFSHSWLTRLRNRHPHWAATVDLNLDVENGAVTKNEVGARVKIERRKAPTRQVLEATYETETNQTPDQPDTRKTVKDEYTVKFHSEWDRGEKTFVFTNPTAERDAPRAIEFRGFAAVGPGYRFQQSARLKAQVQVGLGWVYEQFTAYDQNDYAVAYIGVESTYTLRSGVIVDGTVDYFPSLEKSKAAGLLRASIGLRLPLEDKFYINFRIAEVNDSNPAPDVGDNKFTIKLGLTFTF